jgi:pimeloyl-ACP methyl ester carboxylesterase
MRKWLKRISLAIVVLIMSLALLGFSYEQISRMNAEQKYSPEGILVDVGGHSLHMLIKGNSGPTVVFESGLGFDGHMSWFKVQNEVAKFATTVSYDRAGVLWSERGENPKTAAAIATELNLLLEKSGLKKPYILVGHSLAGVTLRPYLAEHSEDVSGLILVDASHPDMAKEMSVELKESLLSSPPPPLLLKAMGGLGVMRATMPEIFHPNTNKDDRYNKVAIAMFHKGLAGVFDEVGNAEQMMDEVSNIRSLGDIPITVITGTSPSRIDDLDLTLELKNELAALWIKQQKDLLTLSSRSQHILAAESGHVVQMDQPEIVINAIRNMIAKNVNDRKVE